MINSSQPFLYLNSNGQKCLLYCYAPVLRTLKFGNDYSIRPWKIFHKNYTNNQIRPIITPRNIPDLGEVVLECNPHIVNNKLLYTAGLNLGDNEPIVYYFCSLDIDKSLNCSTFQVIEQSFTGTSLGDNIYYANPNKNGKILKKNIVTSETTEMNLDLEYVYRISKIFNEDKFIVTGQTPDRPYFSLLLDENFAVIKEIKNNNNDPVYKCSLLDDSLIYTLKLDEDSYESRELVEETYLD